MLRSLNRVKLHQPPLRVLENATGTCVAYRTKRKIIVQEHVRSIPEERKRVSQLDQTDLTQLKPQYRHVEALEGAPELVRRIFTLEFGTEDEKMESKYLEYAEKLQRHKHDHESLEMRIAYLTIRIRKLQEDRSRMQYESKPLQQKLVKFFKERNNLMLELRFQNFEKYCLTMKVLDLELIFWPEYDFRLTQRAANVADMRTRSFAEIQRQKHEKERRALEVANLQAEILEKLKSGELTVPVEE